MKKIRIPIELQKMNRIFIEAGYEAWLVGGAVRDLVCGKNASDWDIATNAQPEDIIKIFNKVIPTGIEHGTVTVIFMRHHIEVTTFRTEADYKDGRHPNKISYATTIKDDLSRRDFTMNAIAASLIDGHLCDPFNGRKDIKKGIIRTVGNPLERFSEDGLRPVRALRFASQLGFKIEQKTFDAIEQTADITAKISIERFRDEFIKILSSEIPSVGLKLMEKSGTLKQFLPELASCRNVKQADARGHHCFDVLDHLFYACDSARFYPVEQATSAKKDGSAVFFSVRIRLAALFHDIGKPIVRRVEERENIGTCYTFYNHEKESVKIANCIMERLRFPKTIIQYICHLIKEHMFYYESSWSDAAIRRFIVRVMPPVAILPDKNELFVLNQTLDDLFDLRIADVSGMTNTPALMHKGSWAENLIEFRNRIDLAIQAKSAFTLRDLDISGRDLIAAGIPPGKKLGVILNKLLESVIEEPKMNKKETLVKIAKKLAYIS
ncbi:MAG: polynucleotide adenylyltransferase [Treponema sp. CETP13]|nr:MAG: polynucleotide adenylyltransferase [Treponema sp. CETP13]